MFVLTKRDGIIWFTPLFAAVLAAILLTIDGWHEFSWSGAIGLWATIYGAILAIVIFLASTASKTDLAQELDASRATIKGSNEEPGSKQSPQELAAKKKEFANYVSALQEKYKIPDADIVEVKRPGSGERGNRPVLIKTRRGHEYSVWLGGPKAAFYVTDLGSED